MAASIEIAFRLRFTTAPNSKGYPMKKSLLLAALLLSSATQAETYICEVETWQINSPQGNLIERDYRLRTDDGVSIYIDTSRGFREINRSAGEERPFIGECKNGSYVFVVECNESSNVLYHHLAITEDDGRLYFLETNLSSFRIGQMRSGTCFKI